MFLEQPCLLRVLTLESFTSQVVTNNQHVWPDMLVHGALVELRLDTDSLTGRFCVELFG
jgi:hypothetical protein